MRNADDKKRGHAIALFSGGLDSALAILLIQRQNIEVTALTFMTHFGCDLGDRSSCGSNPYPAAEKFGFKVKLMHLGEKFVDIVINPKYGHGKNMNPCTDCRILMLREAKELMELVNADFVITGEVMGQRPMSQTRDKLNLVAKEAGLKGKLLRPLSAKLLPPTEPELSGLVDREQLESISGRSRKRQLELAREFGLDDFPSPASGCLLTDASYSARLRDLLTHTEGRPSFNALNLLKVGRHFRLDDKTKIVVGRNEADNLQLFAYKPESAAWLEVPDVGSPLTLLIGEASEENVRRAAAITARYSAARREPSVDVLVATPERERRITVTPAKDEAIQPLAIR